MRQFPSARLRRNRTDDFIRRLVRENELTCNDLIYPMFIIEGTQQRTDDASMPGIERLSVDLIAAEAEKSPNLAFQPSLCSRTWTQAVVLWMAQKPTILKVWYPAP